MRFAVCLFLLLNCFYLKAQKEVNVWHFGYGAGIDFNASPPLVVTDGKLYTTEGCATICDQFGRLLIYTDGDTVYNGKHQVMLNGTGLQGTASTTQSGMIIKLPKNDSLYLIFNPGEVSGTKKGFYYSIVNIKAAGGRGEVITKNIKLRDNMGTESVSAVKHANGEDVWVVFKNDNSKDFISYLVTRFGVSNTMIFSQPGPSIGGGYPAGYTLCSKFSPSGKKYAICIWNIGICLYDFDNLTGRLSNPIIISLPGPYGVEFSPNGKLLYATSYNNGLYQYDISSNNVTSITASQYKLYGIASMETLGALQLGPDKKMYMVKRKRFLSVVDFPDKLKAACTYRDEYVDLKGRMTGYGLPPFISTYFDEPVRSEIGFTGKCVGDPVKFELSNLKTGDSVYWDFGDVPSGQSNFSSLQKPSHVYTSTGAYAIQVAVFRKNVNNHFVPDGVVDTVIDISSYLGRGNEYPQLLSKCDNDSVLLFPLSGGAASFKVTWSDTTDISLIRKIQKAGLYVAKIYRTTTACFYMDSIEIKNLPVIPKPYLGKDTTYCIPLNQQLSENLGSGFSQSYQYKWNTGETTRTILATKAGTYIVNTTGSNMCPNADTMEINISFKPVYTPLRDTIMCNDNVPKKIGLDAKGFDQISWSTGETGNSVTVQSAGKYRYSIASQCADLKDSFMVTLLDAPVVDLGKDLTICSANGFELKSNVPGTSYLWLPGGETTPVITTYDAGNISLEVKNVAGCSGRDEIFVHDSCMDACFVPNAFTPNSDGLNDKFKPRSNDIRAKGYSFRIYDRWGGIIYETIHLDEGWDGTIDNIICPSGVYFYTVEYINAKKTTIRLKGTFTLLY